MKRAKRNPEKGFSLIETVAAMAVLAVAAVPLMQMTNTSVQHARSLETRMLARTVAENVIAQAIADPVPLPGGISVGTQTQLNRVFNWSLTATPPQQGQLQRFDVTVNLDSGAQVLSEMTSLKLIPLPASPPPDEDVSGDDVDGVDEAGGEE